MSTTKIHHSDVTLYSAGDDYPVGHEITGVARATMLAEYRESGSIEGAFLADPANYPEGSETDICDAGPKVDEIDWTGFLGPIDVIITTSGTSATWGRICRARKDGKPGRVLAETPTPAPHGFVTAAIRAATVIAEQNGWNVVG